MLIHVNSYLRDAIIILTLIQFEFSSPSDTICELGGATDLANYGEYSGAPTESQTFQYAKTILKLMTETTPHPNGETFEAVLFFLYSLLNL